MGQGLGKGGRDGWEVCPNPDIFYGFVTKCVKVSLTHIGLSTQENGASRDAWAITNEVTS